MERRPSSSLGGSGGRGVATWTVQAADWEPSAVVTVMVAVPGTPAVTVPLSSTVATLGSLLVQRTFSAPVTVRVAVSPWFMFRVVWSRVRGSVGVGVGSSTVGLSAGLLALPLPPNSSTPTSTAANTTTSTMAGPRMLGARRCLVTLRWGAADRPFRASSSWQKGQVL